MGVLLDVATRDKTFLVRMEVRDGPSRQACVNEVSVHLAVSIHRGYGSVISWEGGVPLLEEHAEVRVLKAAPVRAVGPDVIGQGREDVPERSGRVRLIGARLNLGS